MVSEGISDDNPASVASGEDDRWRHDEDQRARRRLAMKVIDFLKTLVGLVGGLSVILYATGFVVASTYLAHNGLTDITLVSPRYLSVGACAWALTSIIIVPPIVVYCVTARQPLERAMKGEVPTLKDLRDFQVALLVPVMLLLMGIALSYYFIRTVSTVEEIHVALKRFGSRWADLADIWSLRRWFGYLSGFGILLAFTPFVWSGRPLFEGATLWLYNKVKIPMLVMFILTTFHTALCAVHAYSTSVYPRIRPGFGGGNLGKVRLVATAQNADTLGVLVPMKLATQESMAVRLLECGGGHYAIKYEDKTTQSTVAVMIDKSLVAGVIGVKELEDAQDDGQGPDSEQKAKPANGRSPG
jgi:hypothetical protein